MTLSFPDQRAPWEQLAQCRLDASRDLPSSVISSPRNEDFATKSDYLSKCMLAAGFEFQDGPGQPCQTHDVAHKAVKQILNTCYERRSLRARLRSRFDEL